MRFFINESVDDDPVILISSKGAGVDPDIRDYIELKTVKVPNRLDPPHHLVRLFPKWYIQSYLLGVKTIQIGYRNWEDQVSSVGRKPIKGLLRDAQTHDPSFDPTAKMGRVHHILSALLKYFLNLESISAQDKFELYVEADGDAWVFPTSSRAHL